MVIGACVAAVCAFMRRAAAVHAAGLQTTWVANSRTNRA